jgi:type IV secretion system protein VirB8
MVVVDKTTGFVEVKRALAPSDLHEDEAVTTANIVRYIRMRETYDPKSLKDNFDLAQLLATGEAARDLTELYSPANPKNPIKVFGRQTVVSVVVKSVTFPNDRTALVRFSTEEKSPTNLVSRHWVSLVRFRYSGTPMRNEYRFDNPLGFQTTEYRRDQETADTPGASAAISAPIVLKPNIPAPIAGGANP